MTDLEKHLQHLPECAKEIAQRASRAINALNLATSLNQSIKIKMLIELENVKCTCGLSAAIKKGEGG